MDYIISKIKNLHISGGGIGSNNNPKEETSQSNEHSIKSSSAEINKKSDPEQPNIVSTAEINENLPADFEEKGHCNLNLEDYHNKVIEVSNQIFINNSEVVVPSSLSEISDHIQNEKDEHNFIDGMLESIIERGIDKHDNENINDVNFIENIIENLIDAGIDNHKDIENNFSDTEFIRDIIEDIVDTGIKSQSNLSEIRLDNKSLTETVEVLTNTGQIKDIIVDNKLQIPVTTDSEDLNTKIVLSHIEHQIENLLDNRSGDIKSLEEDFSVKERVLVTEKVPNYEIVDHTNNSVKLTSPDISNVNLLVSSSITENIDRFTPIPQVSSNKSSKSDVKSCPNDIEYINKNISNSTKEKSSVDILPLKSDLDKPNTDTRSQSANYDNIVKNTDYINNIGYISLNQILNSEVLPHSKVQIKNTINCNQESPILSLASDLSNDIVLENIDQINNDIISQNCQIKNNLEFILATGTEPNIDTEHKPVSPNNNINIAAQKIENKIKEKISENIMPIQEDEDLNILRNEELNINLNLRKASNEMIPKDSGIYLENSEESSNIPSLNSNNIDSNAKDIHNNSNHMDSDMYFECLDETLNIKFTQPTTNSTFNHNSNNNIISDIEMKNDIYINSGKEECHDNQDFSSPQSTESTNDFKSAFNSDTLKIEKNDNSVFDDPNYESTIQMFNQYKTDDGVFKIKNDPNLMENEDEEHFQPATNVLFNEADFDFLSQKATSVSPNNNTRDSVLLRFDPLLRNSVVPPLIKRKGYTPSIQNLENINNIRIRCIEESDLLEHGRSSINPLSDKFEEEEEQQQNINQTEIKGNDKMSLDMIKMENEIKSLDSINSKQIQTKHEFKMADMDKKFKNEVVRNDELEQKIKDTESRTENLVKRISDKDKTIAKMSSVVEAYEKAIAELVAEKEQIVQTYEKKFDDLKSGADLSSQHLLSLENTFSDLHAKYERSKQVMVNLKQNEEELLAQRKQLHECLKQQEQRYEKMKSHAIGQLEIANDTLENLSKNHNQEISKLKAQLKKEEISRQSIHEALTQKMRENEELVKICDELIGGGSS